MLCAVYHNFLKVQMKIKCTRGKKFKVRSPNSPRQSLDISCQEWPDMANMWPASQTPFPSPTTTPRG